MCMSSNERFVLGPSGPLQVLIQPSCNCLFADGSMPVCDFPNPSLQYDKAKAAYERVLQDSPAHAKVLQQLGWLYHQTDASFSNQEMAIQYLTRSLESGKLD